MASYGPAAFAELLKTKRVSRSPRVSYGRLAKVTGLSGETIRNWEALTDEQNVPPSATWVAIAAVELELGAQRGELWRALTGDAPPDDDDEPEIDTREMARRLAAVESTLASILQGAPAGPEDPRKHPPRS